VLKTFGIAGLITNTLQTVEPRIHENSVPHAPDFVPLSPCWPPTIIGTKTYAKAAGPPPAWGLHAVGRACCRAASCFGFAPQTTSADGNGADCPESSNDKRPRRKKPLRFRPRVRATTSCRSLREAPRQSR